MSRTLNVVRMQFINKETFVWVPLIVLAGSFAVSLAIYGIIRGATGTTDPMFGGGSQAPLWSFLVVGVQAMTLTFPFSQAMSLTRREFYTGTLVAATICSAMLALVFVGGGLLEQATDGWGFNAHFFWLPWIWESGALGAGFFFFSMAMFFFVIGFWSATVFKRFGAAWLTVCLVVVALLAVAGAFVVTRMRAWTQVFRWLGDQGVVTLTAWGLGLTAVLAVASFLTLRRATV